MNIPAIVLTCQRYAPLAEHMLDAYAALWPDHPFRFRLPDGSAMRAVAARHPEVAELVPTLEGEGRGRFRAAVLGLLEGLSDDEWVYWCIDDKYPIWIDLPVVGRVPAALGSQPPEVAGLCCARRHSPRRERMLAAAGRVRGAGREPVPVLRFGGLRFLGRYDYKRIWLHQFLRVRVLRDLFGGFPEVVSAAKEMDDLIARAVLPAGDRLYALDGNAVVFGESTHRGMLTANCAESLRRHRGLPEGFDISPKRLVIGRRPAWGRRVTARIMRAVSDAVVRPGKTPGAARRPPR